MNLLEKSSCILRELQLENGGILATPENGAYPYIYPRDAVIMTKALNRLGLYKNSVKFYYFMNKFGKLDHHKEIFHRYNGLGLPIVTRKHEHDNTGLMIHGIYDTYLHSKNEAFLESMWLFIIECVKLILRNSRKGLVYTERSIHELFRLESGYEIWANCSCLRGLYDAAEIAKILRHDGENKRWLTEAKSLENNVKKMFFNKKLGVFVKNLKFPNSPDISQLSPFYFNLINDKKVLKRTMGYLKKEIWHKELGGFRRFKKFDICRDWHWYSGGAGPWCVFTIWGAKFYKMLNDNKNYKECINWIWQVAKKTNGLLPEHIATKEEYEMWKYNEIEFNERIVSGMRKSENLSKKLKGNISYWATPLGWAHAEYVLLKYK